MRPHGSQPIVVVHSIGGMVVPRAAEMAPELVGRLVYLAAFIPTARSSAAAYAALPESQTEYGTDLFVGDPGKTGAIRINPKGSDDYLEQLRLAYYHDVPFNEFLPFARLLTPDLPVRFFADDIAVTVGGWVRIPRMYIRCTLDRALAPAVQTLMALEADRLAPGNPSQVIDIESGHSPFMSRSNKLADILCGLAVP